MAVTPTSLVTLSLAWFSVIGFHYFKQYVVFVMAFLQVLVLLQWCVSSGLTLPFVPTAWNDNWRSEYDYQTTVGVMSVALLSAWYVHYSKTQELPAWNPHMRTLHKINSLQYSMRTGVVIMLNVCGLGQASGIHAVYVVAGRIFLIWEKFHYRSWLVLVSFAYLSIMSGLTWTLLYPPIYNFGNCEELVRMHNCSTPMISLAPYLTDVAFVHDECPTECSWFPTESVGEVVDDFDYSKEIGIHTCSTAADCRFASFGWSTLVFLSVILQIGICNFSHDHKERYRRKLQQVRLFC